MDRRSMLWSAVVAALVCVLIPRQAMSQQKSLKEQLVGTWAYLSSTAKLPDASEPIREGL